MKHFRRKYNKKQIFVTKNGLRTFTPTSQKFGKFLQNFILEEVENGNCVAHRKLKELNIKCILSVTISKRLKNSKIWVKNGRPS